MGWTRGDDRQIVPNPDPTLNLADLNTAIVQLSREIADNMVETQILSIVTDAMVMVAFMEQMQA